jgi:outer membrane receptor protein involved in Fe transport
MLPPSKSLQATNVRRIDLPTERAPHGWAAPCWSKLVHAYSLSLGFLLGLALVAQAHAADPGAELGEIIVTGSRIPAQLSTSLVPVTLLDRADLERGHPASIGEILQALPFNTGSPANTHVNNGGDGSERLDLRGLGPNAPWCCSTADVS